VGWDGTGSDLYGMRDPVPSLGMRWDGTGPDLHGTRTGSDLRGMGPDLHGTGMGWEQTSVRWELPSRSHGQHTYAYLEERPGSIDQFLRLRGLSNSM